MMITTTDNRDVRNKRTLDEQTLALPPVIAVFADAALNRDLYLWLAAQAACHVATPAGWLADNLAATRRIIL